MICRRQLPLRKTVSAPHSDPHQPAGRGRHQPRLGVHRAGLQQSGLVGEILLHGLLHPALDHLGCLAPATRGVTVGGLEPSELLVQLDELLLQ